MAYHEWHVGMKVVCVNDQWSGKGIQSRLGHKCPLKRGAVYTVAGFETVKPFYSPDGSMATISVVLDEIKNTTQRGFCFTRFRPVQKRKTDIGIFTAMLNHQKHEVDA